ncbi:TIGR03943 family putative permease subunit [Nocardia sp. XZ_19_385]|uniref:TIGR03943 family putative permease subunit n=1 Tax=Nocardia sp. XZ_19_385 TaxID=2769488 RepID=UPI00188F3670|nr:TIGR03943 family protein [Nocardia sp. XZ_19_385]
MKREAQNLLLLLIGAAILMITLDGTYLNYVKPGLYPFLLLSGILILALALIAIGRDIRSGRATPGHEHGTGRAQWLLLIPVASLLLITPPALGAGAAETTAPVRVADAPGAQPKSWPFPPLPAEPAPALSISELVARATLDSLHSLDERTVLIRGFVLRSERSDGTDLARVAITCCVADARYVRVHLTGIPEQFAEDTWLEIRGRVEPESAQRDPDLTPTLAVTDYQPIERPEHPYERVR